IHFCKSECTLILRSQVHLLCKGKFLEEAYAGRMTGASAHCAYFSKCAVGRARRPRRAAARKDTSGRLNGSAGAPRPTLCDDCSAEMHPRMRSPFPTERMAV